MFISIPREFFVPVVFGEGFTLNEENNNLELDLNMYRESTGKKRYPGQKRIRTAVGGSDIERGGGVSDPVGHSAIWHRKRERGVIVEGPEASDLL